MNPSTQQPEEPADCLLIGCVKRKSARAAPARDLYTSPLWRYRREYAERYSVPWFILSAEHGLLAPDTYIEPYDLALGDLPAAGRRAWSQKVLDQLDAAPVAVAGKTFEVHAGKAYVEYGLERGLRRRGAEVRRPLAHMGIGVQMAWYKARLASGRLQEGRE